MKADLQNVLVLDCETTGLPEKNAQWDVDFMGFPHIVQLAWLMNGVEKNFIIKPQGWEIPLAATEIHGISTARAISEGENFAFVAGEFIVDCTKAELLIGHNVYFDISIVKANIMRDMGREFYDKSEADAALFKGKRIDTMMKTIKFVGIQFPNSTRCKFPKLEELYFKLFNESFPAHDALEDVRAVYRCVPELAKLGIIELKQKEYPTEPQKIEFSDPNPVKLPIGNNGKTEPKRDEKPEHCLIHDLSNENATTPGKVDEKTQALLDVSKDEF